MSRGMVTYSQPIHGMTHMVSSGHYLASAAGYRILEMGGNAIDAGVASGIVINVTQPHMTGFGGVAPIILYSAQQDEVVTISGLGRWPRSATADYFLREQNGQLSEGILQTVTPAAADAWLTALELYGSMTFQEVVQPALELAEQGFPVQERLHRHIAQYTEMLRQWPSSVEVFLPGGRVPAVGEVLVQRDLGRTFRRLIEVERASAHKGREAALRAARDEFYKGDIAREMVRFCQEQGGFLTMEDMAEFQVGVDPPATGVYKEYTIYTCGPWCQGPVNIQVLHLVEGFDLRAMGHNSSDYIHTLLEALKLAYSDRHAYYGDPDLVEVPLQGLLSKEYAEVRRKEIDPGRADPQMPPPGDPWPFQGSPSRPGAARPQVRSGKPQPDTSYTCVVDRWGNLFSATPSDPFKTPIVPGLGLVISSRGRQTWLEEGHPSRLEPWKRPRLTPNPAIAFKNGQPRMAYGTPGGDIQPQAMVQLFLNVTEFGMDPQQAIEEPRFASYSFPDSFWPHPYEPGLARLEGRISKEVAADLERRGHRIEWWPDWVETAGALCAIIIDRERGTLIGGADIRQESYAIGR